MRRGQQLQGARTQSPDLDRKLLNRNDLGHQSVLTCLLGIERILEVWPPDDGQMQTSALRDPHRGEHEAWPMNGDKTGSSDTIRGVNEPSRSCSVHWEACPPTS